MIGAPFKAAGRLGQRKRRPQPVSHGEDRGGAHDRAGAGHDRVRRGHVDEATFSESIDKAVLADFISRPTGTPGTAPVDRRCPSLPELDAVTGVRFDRFLFNGHERDLVAVDSAAAGQVVDIGVQSGSLSDLRARLDLHPQGPGTRSRTQGGRHRRGAVRERRPSERQVQ